MAAALVRWLIFAGILLAAGAVSFRLFVLPAAGREHDPASWAEFRRSAERTATTLGLAAAVSLLVPVLLRLIRQIVRFHDPSAAQLPQIAELLTETRWGQAWTLQLAAVLVLVLVFLVARRTRGAGAWWVAGLVVVPLGASPALAGHAMGAGLLAPVVWITDTAHLLAAGAWLGTLLVLVIVVAGMGSARSRWSRQRITTSLARAFAPLAVLAAGALVITGVSLGAWHARSWDNLVGSRYGALLGLKLLAALLLMSLGAYDLKALKPTLEEAEGSPSTLLRTGTAELLIVAVILLVTSLLVATPHPTGP